MEFIELIKDPRLNIPGVRLLCDESVSLVRSKDLLFSDDPFELGKKTPKMPSVVDVSNYVLELDSQWRLDGHRFFIHKDFGFLLDRIIPSEASVGASIFATDRDVALGYDLEYGKYIFNKEKFKNKKNFVIKGRLGVALSAEISNWGSFVARCAPKAALLRSFDCDYILACCIHKQQYEMLRLLGWKDNQIINYNPSINYVADEYIYPSEAAKDLFLSPQSISLLRGLSRPCKKRRIFISRRSGLASRSGRTCMNAAELEVALINCGFQIVTPDTLTLNEQINLFSESDFVVGPSGAALFNAVFCEKSTKLIDIESSSNWIYGHLNLFSSYELDFGVNWAKSESGVGAHLPFYVDIKSVVSRVEQFL